jgi:hypothetical protein
MGVGAFRAARPLRGGCVPNNLKVGCVDTANLVASDVISRSNIRASAMRN